MTAGKALIDEIRNSHYSNSSKGSDNDNSIDRKNGDVLSKEKNGSSKARRKRRSSKAVTTPSISNTGMFTVTIIGGIGLPGYPLADGEKLAIAKLTPVNIGS